MQLLDGIGAGIFGALFPVVIASLMRGTGRFNTAQGAASTVFGLGGALSTTLAGVIIVWGGYTAAFLSLAVIGAIGFAVYWFAMPETASANRPPSSSPPPRPR